MSCETVVKSGTDLTRFDHQTVVKSGTDLTCGPVVKRVPDVASASGVIEFV